MFGVKRKAEEAQDLSDDLRRKISEIHLAIRAGLPPEKLREAHRELAKLKRSLETKMLSIARNARPAQA